MIKSMIEKEQEIVRFFKEAFCVNGEVKIIIDKPEIEIFKVVGVIELNDMKKKTFYLGLLEKK